MHARIDCLLQVQSANFPYLQRSEALDGALRAVDEYGIISDEVPVAQWIERVPPEHETAGSSPVGDVLIPKSWVRVPPSALNLIILCQAHT